MGRATLVIVWMFATAFSSVLQATPVLPGAPVAVEQPSGAGNSVDKDASVAPWDRAAAWVWAKQREFHRALTQELRELRSADGVGWALVLMSFLYGVFHAAGPGHGKAVLTTYLLTHRQQLARGVSMGAAAALLQGVSALVLVYGLIGLAGWLPRETETASLWAARVSFALLTVVGLYMLARASNSVLAAARQSSSRVRDHDHAHAHDHHHDHDHDHHAGHVHGESCSCKHVPSTAEIESAGSRRVAAGVVLAIGLRPCSGAVLVLILATVMDLIWHGALAVMAMSVGTAITIITLAILATKARDWASSVVEHRSPLWAFAGGGIGMLGGGLLLLFGLLLLSTSFATKPLLAG